MQLIQAVILGLIQGLTEFIPVSSSGHLILANQILNIENGGFVLDVVLNIGTLVALIIYFWGDLIELAKKFVSGKDRKLVWFLIIATIPAVIFGMLLQDLAQSTFRSSLLVSIMLLLVAILMLAVERLTKFDRNLEQMNWFDSLFIGLAQSIALVPGTSRSGITILGGMVRGFRREAAARFSFLLSIPVIFGAVIKVLLSEGAINLIKGDVGVFIAGVAGAFIGGYIAVWFMLRFLESHNLKIFAYYRIILAVIILGIYFL